MTLLYSFPLPASSYTDKSNTVVYTQESTIIVVIIIIIIINLVVVEELSSPLMQA